MSNQAKKQTELLTNFDNVIQDQLTKAVTESVDIDSQDGIKHYLPHHAMIYPTKQTTKLRVVYYVSAKQRQKHQSVI